MLCFGKHGATILRLCALALGALAVQGCGPQLTPEEKIELIRSQYTAELKSLTVRQDPLGVAGSETAAASMEAAPGSEGASGAGAAAEQAAAVDPAPHAGTDEAGGAAPAAEESESAGDGGPPVRTDVILDILVSTTSQDYLPGVTLDVEHVDAERRGKDRRTLWVDTSGLARGGGTQITHVLENVDWEDGDGFYVEVRTPIPEKERAQYREFEVN